MKKTDAMVLFKHPFLKLGHKNLRWQNEYLYAASMEMFYMVLTQLGRVLFFFLILPMTLSLQVLFQGTPRAQTVELHGVWTLSPVESQDKALNLPLSSTCMRNLAQRENFHHMHSLLFVKNKTQKTSFIIYSLAQTNVHINYFHNVLGYWYENHIGGGKFRAALETVTVFFLTWRWVVGACVLKIGLPCLHDTL